MVTAGSLARVTALQPRRAVHVGDRRDLTPAFGPHRLHQQHERVGMVALEEVAAMLVEHAGGERPERLPPLDPGVDDVLGLGSAWVGQDRSGAERPRPDLGPALEPADDPAAGQQRAASSAGSGTGRTRSPWPASAGASSGSSDQAVPK